MGAGNVRTPPPPAAEAGDEPRDAPVMREILRSVGLGEGDYDPAVVQQFLILAYRYAGDVLVDALAYAEHAGRASLEAGDVRLAIQTNAMFCPEPPSREVILEMARSRNEIPLPKPNAPLGSISLPPYQDMLLRQNYVCVSRLKPTPDQVEETEDDDDDEASNPKVASLNSNNEQLQSGIKKQQCSKTQRYGSCSCETTRNEQLNMQKSESLI